MISNVNFLVTDRCNSRCANCNIWRNNKSKDISIEKIKQLFSLKEFSEIKELGISGGEPFIRSDIVDVFKTILLVSKNVETIYITTNAMFPDRVIECLCAIRTFNKKVNISVSIDGNEHTNKAIRGVDNYNDAINLLSKIPKLFPEVKTGISTTISSVNCDYDNLNHIKSLSEKYNCDYTFRLVSYNDSYYNNLSSKQPITEDMKETLSKFIIDHKMKDPFMKEQLYYLLTDRVPIMYNYHDNELLCRAGKEFVFIHSDGVIYPCINSSLVIGNYRDGIKNIPSTSCKEIHNCPCMTECSVMPMIGGLVY